MPRYAGDHFVEQDALDFAMQFGHQFQAIHASPPCQRYSQATFCRGRRETHPDLVDATREVLIQLGLPWVIENVERSPLRGGAIVLCGLMFGLHVFRHRLFESSEALLGPQHPPHGKRRIGAGGFVCVAGHGGQLTGWAGSGTRRTVPRDHRTVAAWSKAIDIDWMTRDELAQAIPPAYTAYVGAQLIRAVRST
jgi:DNA (cytosine-5)-methyltransferase 1